MVPVSEEIKEQFSNFEPVKFVSVNGFKYGTGDTLRKLIYKDAINSIHQVIKVRDNNIIIGKDFPVTPWRGWRGDPLSIQGLG